MDYEPDTNPNSPNSTSRAPDPVSHNAHELFSGPDGDIILRTSDSVDYHVYRVILGLASPVFKTMFTLPQPNESTEDNAPTPNPIIPISELSSVLDLLLRFCYPIPSPRLDELEMTLIGNVLAAALKYEISAAIEPAKVALRARAQRTNEDAMAAYAIACHLKQEDDARIAATACLKWPFPGPKVPQLTMMSALDHYHFLDYHRASCEAIIALFQKNLYDFVTETCSKITPDEHPCHFEYLSYQLDSGDEDVREYPWWAKAKSILSDTFKNAPLDIGKLSLSTIAPGLLTSSCPTCRECAYRGWEETRDRIIVDMENKVKEVELEFSWK